MDKHKLGGYCFINSLSSLPIDLGKHDCRLSHLQLEYV